MTKAVHWPSPCPTFTLGSPYYVFTGITYWRCCITNVWASLQRNLPSGYLRRQRSPRETTHTDNTHTDNQHARQSTRRHRQHNTQTTRIHIDNWETDSFTSKRTHLQPPLRSSRLPVPPYTLCPAPPPRHHQPQNQPRPPNRQVASLTSSGAGVVVQTENGETIEADLVVAADGINSTIRNLVLPEVQPVPLTILLHRLLSPC
jgi:hypothetical protein